MFSQHRFNGLPDSEIDSLLHAIGHGESKKDIFRSMTCMHISKEIPNMNNVITVLQVFRNIRTLAITVPVRDDDLFRFFQKLPTLNLKSITLQCGLKPRIFEYFTKILPNLNLVKLDISLNYELRDSGFYHLTRVLPQCTSLEYLDVSSVGLNNGLDVLGRVLKLGKNKALKLLFVSGNQGKLTTLMDAIPEMNLQCLDVSYTCQYNEEVSFVNIGNLERFYWEANTLTLNQLHQIKEVLSVKSNLKYLNLHRLRTHEQSLQTSDIVDFMNVFKVNNQLKMLTFGFPFTDHVEINKTLLDAIRTHRTLETVLCQDEYELNKKCIALQSKRSRILTLFCAARMNKRIGSKSVFRDFPVELIRSILPFIAS